MDELDTFVGVERLQSRLLRGLSSGAVALTLPTSREALSSKGAPAMIQLIQTWLKDNPEPILVARARSRSGAITYFRRRFQSEYGLVAGFSSARFLSGTGDDVTRIVRPYLFESYSRYASPRIHRGRLTMLVLEESADPRTSASFARLAIKGERGPRKVSFLYLVREHLRRLCERVGIPRLPEEIRESLCDVLYELFANAEEWGGRELDNKPLAKAVRFLAVQVFSGEKKNSLLAQSTSANDGFSKYLNSKRRVLQHPDAALLKVEVFDDGLGLARRMGANPLYEGLSPKEEYGLVRKCMGRHSTTSVAGGRGQGLYEVMECLTRAQGFLAFRGGRLSLYRDFVMHMHMVDRNLLAKSQDMEFPNRLEFLLDRESASEEMREHPLVRGAAYTAWIPVPAPDQLELSLEV